MTEETPGLKHRLHPQVPSRDPRQRKGGRGRAPGPISLNLPASLGWGKGRVWAGLEWARGGGKQPQGTPKPRPAETFIPLIFSSGWTEEVGALCLLRFIGLCPPRVPWGGMTTKTAVGHCKSKHIHQ